MYNLKIGCLCTPPPPPPPPLIPYYIKTYVIFPSKIHHLESWSKYAPSVIQVSWVARFLYFNTYFGDTIWCVT